MPTATVDPYLLSVLLGIGAGSSPVIPFSIPSVVLYGPLRATFNNGQNSLTIHTSETLRTIYATLSDTPPPGLSTSLDLTTPGLVVKFFLQSLDRLTPTIANKTARIANGSQNQVAYDLTDTDMANLATDCGNYAGAFLVIYPNVGSNEGITAEFDGLTINVAPRGY